MRPELTPKAIKEMEECWNLEHRAVECLKLIAMEFESDPTSVQCFDLRTVKEAIEVAKKLRDNPHHNILK